MVPFPKIQCFCLKTSISVVTGIRILQVRVHVMSQWFFFFLVRHLCGCISVWSTKNDKYSLICTTVCFVLLLYSINNNSVNTFIQDTLNWSKATVKTFIKLQKISVSNKCCSFELFIRQKIVKKCTCFLQKYEEEQLFSTCLLKSKSAY